MKRTVQSRIASTLAALLLLGFAAMVYLVFVFPRLLVLWISAGETLTLPVRILRSVSLFCQYFGLILLPLLMGGLIACILWAILSERQQSRSREDPRHSRSPK